MWLSGKKLKNRRASGYTILLLGVKAIPVLVVMIPKNMYCM
jgi:hypothetical protein